ncbi:hypothetical protein SVIO_107220 [Streptomyces violaceusniger]|uniref:Uncharacterized protein n=1 Tax=Streptomyces violaceusniger TaxID=68280 RepID=A0A4D4LQG1_STRVO|nr:hypothetical protein SVIO_107220 [Streptomyces violaceusniger]
MPLKAGANRSGALGQPIRWPEFNWQVISLKYGHLLQALFTRPGGEALRACIDAMGDPEYQRLLRCSADELRERLPGTGSTAGPIADLIAPWTTPRSWRRCATWAATTSARCRMRSPVSTTPARP